jgi:predicted metal-binding protein
MSDPDATASGTLLTVCRTCRPDGAQPGDEPAGAALGRVAAQALRESGSTDVEIRAIACLSACSRSCSASVSAPGKFGYVIGGLRPEDAGDLVAFALRHAEASDGVPPWRARPETIRKNTVARIPPPGVAHPLIEDVREDCELTHDR